MREIVIEGNFLAPGVFIVALRAIRSELAFVGIIFLMAGYAGCRELIAIKIARVAALAFDARVLAAKRKLGHLRVIEFDRVPLD